MATKAANVYTLADHAKRFGPKGLIAQVVEMLEQDNPILEDMVWKETNMQLTELINVRTSLPTVYWRLLNKGSATSKSTTASIKEGTGILEGWSKVDPDVIEIGGQAKQARLLEDTAFLEAMNIEMAETLFYGNAAIDEREFTGLSPRFNDKSGNNAQNIVDFGGSAALTSVWFIVWSTKTVYGIFPQGSKAGITHKDHGSQIAGNDGTSGSELQEVLVTHWKWKAGLALKDWRAVCRIANISITTLAADTGVQTLIESMVKAFHRVKRSLRKGKSVIYMNRSVSQYLDLQRLNILKNGGGITTQTVDGDVNMFFRNIPIKEVDALLETESQVV
jgi:hypothetical protein